MALSASPTADQRRGQLLSRHCTTGWIDRSPGELWLLPDGLLLVRGSLLQRFVDQEGSRRIPRDAVVVRLFDPDEPECLAAKDARNLWIPVEEIRGADLRHRLTGESLNVSLTGGRSVELLLRRQMHASALLRKAFGRWGIRPEWLSAAEGQPQVREVFLESLPRARLSRGLLLLALGGTIGIALAVPILVNHAVRWLFPAGPVGPRIVAAASAPRPQVLLHHPGLYFIADGPIPRAELVALAVHFERKLRVRTELLPPVRPSVSTVDYQRHQLISEDAINEVDAHVRADRPLHAALIAITPYDAYPSTNPSSRFTFGIRGRWGSFGTGLISTARMAVGGDAATRKHRLRVMVSRYIGEAYFDLPQNGDRRSALYNSVRATSDLDRMSEQFCPARPGEIRSC